MRCYRGNIAPSFSSYSGVEIHRLRRIARKLYNIMMHTGAQCLLLAHRDGRRFDGEPSLSGHCGHGPIFIAQRSVSN